MRPVVVLTLVLSFVAGATTAASAEAVDPPGGPGLRPPTSDRIGLVPPSTPTAPTPTRVTIAPRPGETFTPFELVSIQAQPMMKVLRDGSVDPDHAVAYWWFGLDFEPDTDTAPCRVGYYEMPDGALASVSLAEHCDQTYPHDLPLDLGDRLLAAAQGRLTDDQVLADIGDAFDDLAGGLECDVDGSDDDDPDEEEPDCLASEADAEAAIEDAGMAPLDPAVVAAQNQAFTRPCGIPENAPPLIFENCLRRWDKLATTGTIAELLRANYLPGFRVSGLLPCLGRAASVVSAMLTAAVLLSLAATERNPAWRTFWRAAAWTVYGAGWAIFLAQVYECVTLISSAQALGPPAGPAIISAMIALTVSGAAIITVSYGVNNIDRVKDWWLRGV